jgi:dTDP-4-dehydrorhamnose reductase
MFPISSREFLQNIRGIVHLTSVDPLSKYEFGCLVAEALHLDSTLITPTDSPGGAKNISLDTDKAVALLGVQLPTQRDGIARAMAEREFIRFP